MFFNKQCMACLASLSVTSTVCSTLLWGR